ncbi:hypothetical protein BS78_05G090800 [Paspalum vaginatum]|nr:hypothetical protein BS78_05G090800 [Paspalum vaginatum]
MRPPWAPRQGRPRAADMEPHQGQVAAQPRTLENRPRLLHAVRSASLVLPLHLPPSVPPPAGAARRSAGPGVPLPATAPSLRRPPRAAPPRHLLRDRALPLPASSPPPPRRIRDGAAALTPPRRVVAAPPLPSRRALSAGGARPPAHATPRGHLHRAGAARRAAPPSAEPVPCAAPPRAALSGLCCVAPLCRALRVPAPAPASPRAAPPDSAGLCGVLPLGLHLPRRRSREGKRSPFDAACTMTTRAIVLAERSPTQLRPSAAAARTGQSNWWRPWTNPPGERRSPASSNFANKTARSKLFLAPPSAHSFDKINKVVHQ